MIENIFYNYVYLDPRKPGDYNYGNLHFDFEPFYIGKGFNGRLYEHLFETKDNTHNNKKFNKIQKIRRATGQDPIILKIFENLEESISLENEIYLIKLIGRHNSKLGPLTNLTDGGEGSSGRIMSNKSKEKNKNSHLGKKHTLKSLKLMSYIKMGENNNFYNKHHTDESKNLISNKNSKKVYKHDFINNIFNIEYKSIKCASIENNNIHMGDIISCCKCKLKTAGSYFWSYEILSNEEIKNKLHIIENKQCARKVYKHDYKNNIFNIEYESIISAFDYKKPSNYTSICACCKGKLKTAGGYFWSYEKLTEEEIKNRIVIIKNRKTSHKNVYKINKDDNTIICEFK